MMTFEEMVTINRTAEKIAAMGVRPPGPESQALAARLFAVIKGIREDVLRRFPTHTDRDAFSVLMLGKIDAQAPVVEAAQCVVWAADNNAAPEGATAAMSKLIAATHVYNLVNEQPEAKDPDHEEP